MREVWRFETVHFCVTLEIEEHGSYEFEGGDPNGETQAKLDNGELVAFDSSVTVRLKSPLGRVSPVPVGADWLGGSVCCDGDIPHFYKGHWLSPWQSRNCMRYRAEYGENTRVCHYFPDMVRHACAEARRTLLSMPDMRLSGRTI